MTVKRMAVSLFAITFATTVIYVASDRSPVLIDVPSALEMSEPAYQVSLDELRQVALDEVNRERTTRGLGPLSLGNNGAAQDHANEMLAMRYLGHWWSDGRKPYMVYSEHGGRSYGHENVANAGWKWHEFHEDGCGIPPVQCGPLDPIETVKDRIHAMIYDDAHANWGHRDSILGAQHLRLNVGIAYDETYVAFVLHLEGGHWEIAGEPSLTGAVLDMSLRNVTGIYEAYPVVSVYFDPAPRELSFEELERFDKYCIGGGFTDECDGTESVAAIIKPPAAGTHYTDLDPKYVVADSWSLSAKEFSFTADLGRAATEPGYYTVLVFYEGDDPDTIAEVTLISP